MTTHKLEIRDDSIGVKIMVCGRNSRHYEKLTWTTEDNMVTCKGCKEGEDKK